MYVAITFYGGNVAPYYQLLLLYVVCSRYLCTRMQMNVNSIMYMNKLMYVHACFANVCVYTSQAIYNPSNTYTPYDEKI